VADFVYRFGYDSSVRCPSGPGPSHQGTVHGYRRQRVQLRCAADTQTEEVQWLQYSVRGTRISSGTQSGITVWGQQSTVVATEWQYFCLCQRRMFRNLYSRWVNSTSRAQPPGHSGFHADAEADETTIVDVDGPARIIDPQDDVRFASHHRYSVRLMMLYVHIRVLIHVRHRFMVQINHVRDVCCYLCQNILVIFVTVIGFVNLLWIYCWHCIIVFLVIDLCIFVIYNFRILRLDRWWYLWYLYYCAIIVIVISQHSEPVVGVVQRTLSDIGCLIVTLVKL